MAPLIAAFISAAGLPAAPRARGLASVSARPARAAGRWHMTSTPPPSDGQKTTTDSLYSKPSSSTSSQSSETPTLPDEYMIDGEELLEKAKLVVADVSDRPFYYSKIFGYGAGGIVLLTVLRAVVSAIDSLPVVPAALELIGLGYAAWFVWRYVLFRESRAELLEEIDDFLGRTRPGGSD